MGKQTTAILWTILTTLLCGLPGLVGFCFGSLAILGSLLPDSEVTPADARIALVTGIVLTGISLLFIATPILTAILAFRRGGKKLVVPQGVIPEDDF